MRKKPFHLPLKIKVEHEVLYPDVLWATCYLLEAAPPQPCRTTMLKFLKEQLKAYGYENLDLCAPHYPKNIEDEARDLLRDWFEI